MSQLDHFPVSAYRQIKSLSPPFLLRFHFPLSFWCLATDELQHSALAVPRAAASPGAQCGAGSESPLIAGTGLFLFVSLNVNCRKWNQCCNQVLSLWNGTAGTAG